MKSLSIVLAFLFVWGFAMGQEKKAEPVRLYVAGMECKMCVAKVTKALKSVEGVQDANVSIKEGTADIVLVKDATISNDALITAVTKAGFGAGATMDEAKKGLSKAKEECEKKNDCKDSCKVKKGMDGHKMMKKEGDKS